MARNALIHPPVLRASAEASALARGRRLGVRVTSRGRLATNAGWADIQARRRRPSEVSRGKHHSLSDRSSPSAEGAGSGRSGGRARAAGLLREARDGAPGREDNTDGDTEGKTEGNKTGRI